MHLCFILCSAKGAMLHANAVQTHGIQRKQIHSALEAALQHIHLHCGMGLGRFAARSVLLLSIASCTGEFP